MTKTPDVAQNGTVTSAWGNEIRDRSIQVFATAADRDAWLAPAGAEAVVTDDYMQYQRRDAAGVAGLSWIKGVNYDCGIVSTLTSAAESDCWIYHDRLAGVASAAVFQPRNVPSNLGSVVLAEREAGRVRVKCYALGGGPIGSVSVSISWVVFA